MDLLESMAIIIQKCVYTRAGSIFPFEIDTILIFLLPKYRRYRYVGDIDIFSRAFTHSVEYFMAIMSPLMFTRLLFTNTIRYIYIYIEKPIFKTSIQYNTDNIDIGVI